MINVSLRYLLNKYQSLDEIDVSILAIETMIKYDKKKEIFFIISVCLTLLLDCVLLMTGINYFCLAPMSALAFYFFYMAKTTTSEIRKKEKQVFNLLNNKVATTICLENQIPSSDPLVATFLKSDAPVILEKNQTTETLELEKNQDDSIRSSAGFLKFPKND